MELSFYFLSQKQVVKIVFKNSLRTFFSPWFHTIWPGGQNAVHLNTKQHTVLTVEELWRSYVFILE